MCDNDGFTSAAALYLYIKDLYPDREIHYFIHDGKQHGLEDIIKNDEIFDYNLVLIPDASSNDYEYHKELKERGIDVIVLDHHEAPEVSNFAIVVNNQLSKRYENKALSGAGVVYKFLKLMDKNYGINKADYYLDLIAVGIIGDMMSLLPLENRYIIKQGLSHINNPGLKSLIEKQSFSIGKEITPTAIAFYITPLINAVIRVGKQEEKELLFESFIDGEKIVKSTKRGAAADAVETIGEQVARLCTNARNRQNRAKEKAIEQLEIEILKNSLDMNKVIAVVVEDDSISSTLTGLVAMQIMNKYKKPTLILREDDYGVLKGSGRNDNHNELKDFRAFLENSGYFEFAEGHASAFGCAITKENLDKFIDYANRELKDYNFNEGIYEVDFIFKEKDNFSDLILDLAKGKELWGKDIDEPIIVIEDIPVDKSKIQLMGANKDTIKITLSNGVSCLSFKNMKFIEEVTQFEDCKITILGRANLNEWMGNITPQIFIDDYNIIDTTFDF